MKQTIYLKHKKTILFALLCIVCFFLFFAIIPIPSNNDWNYSKAILDKNNEILRVYLDKNQQWHLPYNDDVPEKLKVAITQYEDKRFYKHLGVDNISIIRALISNIKAKRVVSGGSTLTMQVIRIWSKHPRTISYKFLEYFQALKLEIFYSKDEILKMYLNNAPYGGNILGINCASYKYFHKQLEELTWAEACMFAILPNNPGYLYPGKNNNVLKRKRDSLLAKLTEQKIITPKQYQFSIREDIPSNQHKYPLIAPHFSDLVAKDEQINDTYIKTTLDKNIQRICEEIASFYTYDLHSLGIKNLAFIVSDTHTREIKAYVGSQDYLSNNFNGFIDGNKIHRSSGSVLKPFIYAKAIDLGIITKESLIEDVNTYYGDFLPKNFSNHYDGLVSLNDALIYSLNMPAYNITNQVGVYQTCSMLKNVGMKSLIKDPNSYGLSICIGGAETSNYELCEMYLTLANYGKHGKLTYLKNQKKHYNQTTLSPASCYQILKILENVNRPINDSDNIDFSWKTGTSNGFRDAWAVGTNPDWTISVWCGNFTGEGNPHLIGNKIAGTLLFEILKQLPTTNNLFVKPQNAFKKIKVCKSSGFMATDKCSKTKTIDVPINTTSFAKCKYHKKITVDSMETMQLCSKCWKNIPHKQINVLSYPPIVEYYLNKNRNYVNHIPPHNPKCSTVINEKNLYLKYPIDNSRIILPRDANVIIAEAFSKTNSPLYWFLNDKLIAQTTKFESNKRIIQKINICKSGTNTLFIINELGESIKVHFTVNKSD